MKATVFPFVVSAALAVLATCPFAWCDRIAGAENIVLITEFSSGSHAAQYIQGAVEEAASLGFDLEILDANNNRERMAMMMNNAVIRKVDGIMISHGDPEILSRPTGRAIAAGIPVVAFDCEIPGDIVVKIDQDDHKIARMCLQRLIRDTGGEAGVAIVWVPGYAPMEKRMETYMEIMNRYPGIKERVRFGNVTNSTALATRVEMKSILERHPPGTIDAVWAAYDEFAKGAASAIVEMKRNEIRIYGVDISDEGLRMIQDPENPWVATVGTAPRAIGKVQVRILAYRMAGQPVPKRYSLQPFLVDRDMLPENVPVTMENLSRYVPGFGDAPDFLDPWILKMKNSAK